MKPKNLLFLRILALMFITSSAFSQQTITQWNFNPFNDAFPASTGTGTLTVIGGLTVLASGNAIASAATDFSSDPVDPATNNDALQLKAFPAQSTNSGTAGIEIAVSTVGFENIKLTFDTRSGNATSKFLQVRYSVNGTDWVNSSIFTMTAAMWHNNLSVDFSSITATKNNPNFKVRIVAIFEPGQTTYTGTTKAYEANKPAHYDMVTISGTQIHSNIGAIAKESLTIYPNPASEIVKVKATAGDKVTLYNRIGAVVERFTLNSNIESLNVKHYPNGMYLLQIESNDVVYQGKLIKN
jgi:hypothetical protein